MNDITNLTKRQLTVAKHIATGKRNREIADEMGIRYETVKEHVEHILKRLGLRSRVDIAVLVVRTELQR